MSVAGLHYVRSARPGQPVRWYVYAWRGGPRIMATTGPHRPALDAAAVQALHQAQAERGRADAGTVSDLVGRYRASAAWAGLSPSTRRQWAYVLADIEEKWGTVPLAVFDDRRMKGKVIAWRDTVADRPRKADYRVQVLSALLSWARLIGDLAINVAEGIPALWKGGRRAAIIWTDDEVKRWQDAAQPVRDAVNLARLTGLRRGDLVALPRSAVHRNAIVWQTAKSGQQATVVIPILPELATVIADLRTRPRKAGVETLLVNSRGQAWTANGLDSSFGDERRRLGLPDKHLHDFRGTWCTALCRAGLTDQEIARLMGWTVNQVAAIRAAYVDDAQIVIHLAERLANAAVK